MKIIRTMFILCFIYIVSCYHIPLLFNYWIVLFSVIIATGCFIIEIAHAFTKVSNQ